ncbi:hypothetical protein G6F46_010139 [Rhizopus delemar]|nr:hypothetical protein G6F55_007359 [Rhizopus delemar]KAG1537764.1 hypothetical protein G6F51_010176 [Rhizopus arrhizus]KAG1491847.1 hypothetical protein G6F54_009722 [Rhizopus delemar]KAG1506186.1 hypothetical protein G6F53_009876 [Rhizopus delemar]KAG1519926.1 hypothetical protein G6F52_008148 [Rhizopus delemar]
MSCTTSETETTTAAPVQYLTVPLMPRILSIPSLSSRSSNLPKNRMKAIRTAASSLSWIVASVDLTRASAGYRKAAH